MPLDNTTMKFKDGPFKGLVFRVQHFDEKTQILTVKFALTDRTETMSQASYVEWGPVAI